MRIALRVVAAGLLAIGLTVGPAVAASASASVTVQWVTYTGTYTRTYSCSGTATYNGYYVSYVSNGCGNRVWLHANTNGSGASYCINPGAIAYGFGSYTQAQLSGTATSACDAGVKVTTTWWNGVYGQYTTGGSFPADCIQGNTYWDQNLSPLPGAPGWYYLLYLTNKCNTRIWVHQYQNGSGAAYCISPGATYDATTGAAYNWEQAYGGEQILISSNQAPCSAG